MALSSDYRFVWKHYIFSQKAIQEARDRQGRGGVRGIKGRPRENGGRSGDDPERVYTGRRRGW